VNQDPKKNSSGKKKGKKLDIPWKDSLEKKETKKKNRKDRGQTIRDSLRVGLAKGRLKGYQSAWGREGP